MTSHQRADAPREWDAQTYHRIATPHVDWGSAVLDQMSVRGDETAIDLGCGTGRLTGLLLQRLPRGRVIAVDGSANMIAQARDALDPRFPGQVEYVVADLLDLDLDRAADLVFSTATFHWIADHARLFRIIHRALRPGGRLHAQCGGGPNIEIVARRAMVILRQPPFQAHIGDWPGPWTFSFPEITRERLEGAGFVDVRTGLVHAPVTFDTPDAYREFLETVVFGAHLDRLPDLTMRSGFLDRMVAAGARDDVPYRLDYWRMNLSGTRPA